MCGRYATTRSAADLATLFEALDETKGGLTADYNVAPTDPVPIVRAARDGHRAVLVARWGLVPHWARDTRGAARMINARAETVATGSAYGPAFARHRCLIPADGWYEWRRREDGPGKQAHFMTPRDGSIIAFGGLWSRWSTDSDTLVTCSIVTMAAYGELAEVHDRMPLIVSPERWAEWLSGPADPARLLARPAPEVLADLEIRPVGPAVGDVRNDGPELIRSVGMTPAVDEYANPTDATLF